MSEIPDGWSVCKVAETVERGGLVGGPFGSSLGTRDYVEDGVPVIRGQNLGGPGRFNSDGFVFVSEEKADSLARNLAVDGDLVLTQRGTLGQVGLVPSGVYTRYVVSQSQMRLRPSPQIAVSDFLYYVFRSPMMLDMIDARAIVTGVPHINLGILGELPLLLPPIAEQRAIAGVLGALDDKIESNRCIKATLRKLSDTCLRACLGSPIPGLGEPDSRMRVIHPDGGEISIVSPGLPAVSTSQIFEYLPTAAVHDNWYEAGDLGTREELPSRANMQAGFDRVWFARMKATSKNLWTPQEFSDDWVSLILSTGFMGLECADSRLAPLIMTAVGCWEFDEAKDQLCNGTTMQSLNNDSAKQLGFCVPTDQRTLDTLSTELRSNLLMEHALVSQSRALSETRDAILPQLLSGRLRIRDAERVVGDAV